MYNSNLCDDRNVLYISIVQYNSHQPNVGNYHLKYGLSNLIEALFLI